MSPPPTPRNTSRTPRVRLSAAEWRELENRIIERLDIKAAYESMGVRFTGRSSNGRLLCHAVDRVEKGASDSAGVNVGNGPYRGRYYDFGGQKLSLNLWEFGSQYGGFTDWKECRRHFAGVAGVPYPDQPEYVSPSRAARPAAPPRAPAADDRIRENIGRDLDKLHAYALASGELDRTACRLHVHRDALIAQRMGFAPFLPHLRQYTFEDEAALIFPECQVIGLTKPQRQSADRRGLGESKRKQALYKRPRGVTIPHGWDALAKESGHLLICEGASDVAALYSMGLGVLGIPMKGACAEEIALLIGRAIKNGRIPAGVAITVMVDRDGDKGGYASMQQLAQHLADALKRPVAGRYAPTIPGYHKEYREFPGVRLPFADDESDPRWAAWHKRKGVAKDSREWLGWVCNAETLDTPARRVIGLRFLGEIEPVFDVSPQVDTTKAASDTPVHIGGSGCDTYHPRDHHGKCRTPIHRYVPNVTYCGHEAKPEELADLERLPVWMSCPKPCLVLLGRKSRVREGMGIHCPCMGWNCVACRYRRIAEWGQHLGVAFLKHTPAAFYFWRGPVAQRDRVRKNVSRKRGRYACILTPGDQATVIATVDFPGATAIDRPTAIREMVAAVKRVEYRPAEKHRRVRPISASHGWGLPDKPKSGEFEGLARRFRRPDVSNAILVSMGVTVRNADQPRAKYNFPARWTKTDRKRAAQWAALEVNPSDYGYAPGGPVPAIDDVADYLASLDVDDWDDLSDAV